MRDLLVDRRRWLTDREFATTATVAQMLPGGAAANALAYTGHRFLGPAGAVAAYAAFIAPGAALVTALAALYTGLGVTPRLQPLLAGLNAGVVGVVGAITLKLARSAIGRAWQMGVAAAALLLALAGGAGAGEVAALGIVAGLVIDLGTKRYRLARQRLHGRRPPPPAALPDEGGRLPPGGEPERGTVEGPGPGAGLPAIAWLAGAGSLGALGAMALLFARAGLGAYGGGFAIIPALQATVLEQGWNLGAAVRRCGGNRQADAGAGAADVHLHRLPGPRPAGRAGGDGGGLLRAAPAGRGGGRLAGPRPLPPAGAGGAARAHAGGGRGHGGRRHHARPVAGGASGAGHRRGGAAGAGPVPGQPGLIMLLGGLARVGLRWAGV